MSKKIEFEYKDKKYILEYNRKAVEYIERQGFCVNEMSEKPMLMLPLAFSGLFFKNHKNTPQSLIDEIFDNFANKDQLLSLLAEMLSETYNTLQTNSDNEEGNIEWKVV